MGRDRRCSGAPGSFLLLLLLLLQACTGETVTEVSVSEVEVVPPTVSAVVGESVRLNALVRDELGEALPQVSPIWSSEDPSVAEVDASGLVRARASGRVEVRATYDGVSGTSQVRVFAGPGIAASTEAVVMLAAADGPSPAPVAVYVTNVGTGTLEGLTAEARHPDDAPEWLTATLDDTSAPASLTLRADSDELSAGAYTAEVRVSTSTPDVEPLLISATLRIAGVEVRPSARSTVVSESGSRDSLVVTLGSAPEEEVVLEVTSQDPSEATVSPGRLTFTPASWSSPQTVTVTGVDDALLDGDQVTDVRVSVDAAASDPAYDLVDDLVAQVTTRDDDEADVVVTESGGATVVTEAGGTDQVSVVLTAEPARDVTLDVTSANPLEVTASPSRLTFTPANWGTPQAVTLTGVDDVVADGDRVTIVRLSVDRAASDDAFDSVADRTIAVTTTDDDEGGIFVSESGAVTVVNESGGTDDLAVSLTAPPVGDVVLDVTSADPFEVTVAPSRLTFTPTSWNVPQTVTVTGVDDAFADGDQTTTLTISVDAAASDDGYDAAAARTVSATTVDDDRAGFTVTETGGSTVVSEAGGADGFTVALTAAPIADVVLILTSSDPTDVAVSPTHLTFTSASWSTAQTVTVTAVDDATPDGHRITTVRVSVDAAASDPAFGAVPDQLVSVTTLDNDAAGLSVTETAGSTLVSEAGGTDDITVALTAAPASSVDVAVTSGDPQEVTASPSRVTFTSGSWSAPRTVRLTGVDDTLIDGDQVTPVTVAIDPAASDPAYAAVAPQTVGVTTTDDDVAGMRITESGGGTQVTEAGGSDEFTVALAAAPSSPVELSVASADTAEVTVIPSLLTFDAVSWSVPQTVTTTGVDDSLPDGPRVTTVTVSVVASASDDAYDAVPDEVVSVTTLDDEGD